MFEFMGDRMNERDCKPFFYRISRIFVGRVEKQNILTVCW